MKSICDSSTGIMVGLELNEGKLDQSMKKFYEEYGATTAVTLRLAQPWFSTGRAIVGDSYFSSVKTAKALAKHGLYFCGVVKTATKMFPLGQLEELSTTLRRGHHIALKSVYGDNSELYALSWKDKKIYNIISTFGTLEDTQPIYRNYKKVVETNGIKSNTVIVRSMTRPKIIADLYDNLNIVDIHDHYRQGVLEPERRWKTKTWWKRLLATMFGIHVTDAYLSYRYEFASKVLDNREQLCFCSFAEKLAQDLCCNPYSDQPMALRRHSCDGIKVCYDFISQDPYILIISILSFSGHSNNMQYSLVANSSRV